MKKKTSNLSLIIPAHGEIFSTFPCLWFILYSCLAAPSPPLLLFKGLPAVLLRPGRPSQKHVSCELWIATRALSQGCLSLRRMQPQGLAKSPPEREALLSRPQALFSLKILDHSPLPDLINVCASNQLRSWAVQDWIFFVDIPVSCWQLYLCNGEVRAAELVTSPSPLQVSSILPLSEVRLPGWSGSCSAGQAAEELQFSSR